MIDLELDDDARPWCGLVRCRGWSEGGRFWRYHAPLYPGSPGGRLGLDPGGRLALDPAGRGEVGRRKVEWGDTDGAVRLVPLAELEEDLPPPAGAAAAFLSGMLDDDDTDGAASRLVASARPEVREGLGILCAAREALPLDVLGELAGWTDKEVPRFLRDAEAILVEGQSLWPDRAYGMEREAAQVVAEQLGAETIRRHHETLAQTLAAWPPSTEPARRYASHYALTHRAEAGAWDAAWRLATDLDFLEAFCREPDFRQRFFELTGLAARCRERGDKALGRCFEDLAQAFLKVRPSRQDPPEMAAAIMNRLRLSEWGIDEVRRTTKADWQDPDPVLRVIDQLVRVAGSAAQELGLDAIQRLSGRPDLRESLQIAEYLASERIGILAARFTLVRGDAQEALSDEIVYGALRTGILHDPRTGAAIDDWPRRVVVSYKSLAASLVERR